MTYSRKVQAIAPRSRADTLNDSARLFRRAPPRRSNCAAGSPNCHGAGRSCWHAGCTVSLVMSHRVPSWVCVCVLLLGAAWSVSGCAVEETGEIAIPGFSDATSDDLARKSFRFGPDAGLFTKEDPRYGQSATLIIGEFRSTDPLAAFSLTTDDGSLQGGILELLDGPPCSFFTQFLQLAGEDPQIDSLLSQDFFELCAVDPEGRLGLLEDDETLPIISDPPTDPTVDLDETIVVLPSLVVDPAIPLDARPETGSVELELLGNVLSYSVTIDDLLEADEVRDGHIRRGAASENGDLLVSLFGEPVQPVRSFGPLFPPFIAGSSITASVFVTPDEADTLTDAASPLYISITSRQVSSGLLRGQLRDVP